MIRSLLAAIAAVAVAAACGSSVPQPTPSGGPTAPPSAAPGATTEPSPGSSTDVTAVATDFLTPAVQPAIPGLYLPAGTRSRGTDHYAFIQADFDCEQLVSVLGAGEWSGSEPISPPMPSPDPSAGTPELSLPEWMLMRWAEDAAVARIGGDESGCVAQIWRLARATYQATGAIEATGEAQSLQSLCAAGPGEAQLGATYFAQDGTMFTVESQVPLEIGSHPLPIESELSAGQPGIDIGEYFGLVYGGAPMDEGEEVPEMVGYFPSDFEAGVWEGSIEVATIEPLTGEFVFENARNESGQTLNLRTQFRCDLPPGQLTRAAEAADATPGPDATPTPAPGEIAVDIASGPHAGSHSVTSEDVTCSLNAFNDDNWLVTYSTAELVQGELQTLTLTVPGDGGRAEVFMIFGDDLERDWFNARDATAQVSDNGATATFVVTGRDAGTDFELTVVCHGAERF